MTDRTSTPAPLPVIDDDEASKESFPASDAPARTPVTGVHPKPAPPASTPPAPPPPAPPKKS